MASFNLKMNGFNENKEKPIDFILSNDEIKSFTIIYNAENSKNANHSTDNRILEICCSIDRIMEQDATNKNIKDADGQLIYGKTRMHLLRRWSKQKYVDNHTNGWSFLGNTFYDEYYKDIVISFIHGGLEVRKVEFCKASLDYYEENISSDGLDNILILRLKQIENQKSDILFDDHSLLIGQKRYVGKDGTAKLTGSGVSVGEIIPAGTEVTLLDSKRDANGLVVITVSYIDANGMKQNAIVNCTDLRPFAVAVPSNSTENDEPIDDIEPIIPVTPTQGGDLNALPTALRGSSNEEKTWNYFIDHGLTPIAAAGAMGNIEGESNFNPFKQEGSGSGWGLIQWSPAITFNDNKHPDTPSDVKAGATSGDNDTYLLWQLHALWKRGGNPFWENLNKETSVGNYKDSIPEAKGKDGQFTGNYQGEGSAYYFHAKIEISGDMDWGLDNSGKPNRSRKYKDKWHGNIRKRPYWADHFLKKYCNN